jgi:hypothetical protein
MRNNPASVQNAAALGIVLIPTIMCVPSAEEPMIKSLSGETTRPASGVGATGQRLILKEDGVIITAGDAAATGRRAG